MNGRQQYYDHIGHSLGGLAVNHSPLTSIACKQILSKPNCVNGGPVQKTSPVLPCLVIYSIEFSNRSLVNTISNRTTTFAEQIRPFSTSKPLLRFAYSCAPSVLDRRSHGNDWRRIHWSSLDRLLGRPEALWLRPAAPDSRPRATPCAAANGLGFRIGGCLGRAPNLPNRNSKFGEILFSRRLRNELVPLMMKSRIVPEGSGGKGYLRTSMTDQEISQPRCWVRVCLCVCVLPVGSVYRQGG